MFLVPTWYQPAIEHAGRLITGRGVIDPASSIIMVTAAAVIPMIEVHSVIPVRISAAAIIIISDLLYRHR
jgi:hypothetical protein